MSNFLQNPFGMLMGERTFLSEKYRLGFNGQEKDEEVSGAGNNLDFGARIYDGRLGRWMSVDPLVQKYPGFTPYNFAINNPICWIDKDGRDIIPTNWFLESGYNVVLNNMIDNNLTFYTKYLKDYHTIPDKKLYFQYNNKPFTPETTHGPNAAAEGKALSPKAGSGGAIRFSIANENYYPPFSMNDMWEKSESKEIMKAALMIHEMVFHVSEGTQTGSDHQVSSQQMRDAVNMLMEYSDKVLPQDKKISTEDAAILTLNGFLKSKNFNTYLNQINNEFGLNISKNDVETKLLDVGYNPAISVNSETRNAEQFPEYWGNKAKSKETESDPIKVDD
jgi:RHS repeat-associated protein